MRMIARRKTTQMKMWKLLWGMTQTISKYKLKKHKPNSSEKRLKSVRKSSLTDSSQYVNMATRRKSIYCLRHIKWKICTSSNSTMTKSRKRSTTKVFPHLQTLKGWKRSKNLRCCTWNTMHWFSTLMTSSRWQTSRTQKKREEARVKLFRMTSLTKLRMATWNCFLIRHPTWTRSFQPGNSTCTRMTSKIGWTPWPLKCRRFIISTRREVRQAKFIGTLCTLSIKR